MPAKYIKNTLVLLISLLLASCANTRIIQSWVENEPAKKYQHPMIIAISDSQQTRRIFEKHLVTGLRDNNIVATPSYRLISSKQKMNRETVIEVLQDTEMDSVLVTYLIAADTEMRHHDSPINIGYSGNIENNMMSDTIISARSRTSDSETIMLKSDFYDAQSKAVVWSVRTKTVAPDSIDEVITDVTQLLVKQLLKDDIL